MATRPAQIRVLAGNFASQPLVFAHLWDEAPDLDLGEVEVICRADPHPRLLHHFAEAQVRAIEDALGLADTCVLLFEEAGKGPDATSRLWSLGVFPGHRHVPGPG